MYGLSQEGCGVTRNYFAKSLPNVERKAEARMQSPFSPKSAAAAHPNYGELRTTKWFVIDLMKEGHQVIMKTIKIMTMAVMLAAFFAALVIVSAASRTAGDEFDAAATFKTKCVACHGQKAEKKFDSSLPDAQLIDIVMKGKKPEKPPNMPAYGEKGVTADQAKALVEHMKQLKSAP